MDKFLSWLNNRNLVGLRAIIVYVTLYITYRSFLWSVDFSGDSKLDAVGTAAVIGAVTGPVSILLGAIVKFYVDSKGYDD